VKLGFLTACLPNLELAAIAAWAARVGYEALEVAAWPAVGDRDFTAGHLDVRGFDRARADDVRALFDRHQLELSSLAYYDNNVLACIEAAALLECPAVGTFVGRDQSRSVAENLVEAETVFAPLVDRAGERGVRLMIENCPMEGWHADGYPGNLAYSPELWEWMFALGLDLNFDPSHLLWLGIDPVAAVRPYLDRIPHAHAKDAELFPERRDRYGVFGMTRGRSDPWDAGWWRYRMPGLGQIDWRRLVDVMYEGGFTGVLSVEHEDPVWGGSEDHVKAGLEVAHRTLRPLLVR